MSWVTLVVVLAAVGTLVVASRRAGQIFQQATIEAAPILAEIEALCLADDRDSAHTLAQAARPAWLGETLSTLLGTKESAELATDDLLYSLRARAEALRDLRPLARIASFSGVLGATLELLIIMMYGEGGTGDVASALAEVETTQRAYLAIAIGMTASTLILYIMMLSYRRARHLVKDCHRAVRLLRRLSDSPDDALGSDHDERIRS